MKIIILTKEFVFSISNSFEIKNLLISYAVMSPLLTYKYILSLTDL